MCSGVPTAHGLYPGPDGAIFKGLQIYEYLDVTRLRAGFPPRRPGFRPGSGHVGFCDGQKWRWGRFSPRTSVSHANLHSICFSTIIFTITRGWHNRPGVAAVPIPSNQIKKKNDEFRPRHSASGLSLASHRGICGGPSGAGAGFLQVLQFPLPIFIPPIFPQSPSSIIRGWYNRPVVAAVPKVPPHKLKKNDEFSVNKKTRGL
jgi:hypothetical protein